MTHTQGVAGGAARHSGGDGGAGRHATQCTCSVHMRLAMAKRRGNGQAHPRRPAAHTPPQLEKMGTKRENERGPAPSSTRHAVPAPEASLPTSNCWRAEAGVGYGLPRSGREVIFTSVSMAWKPSRGPPSPAYPNPAWSPSAPNVSM